MKAGRKGPRLHQCRSALPSSWIKPPIKCRPNAGGHDRSFTPTSSRKERRFTGTLPSGRKTGSDGNRSRIGPERACVTGSFDRSLVSAYVRSRLQEVSAHVVSDIATALQAFGVIELPVD